MTSRALILIVSVVLCPAAALFAEDAPPAPKTVDPNAPVAELRFALQPLTKGELGVEADGWMKLLAGKVGEISAKEIAAARAEGEAETALRSEVGALQTQRAQIVDRLNAVLAELRSKGGASDDYDKYIAAVSGVKVDATDVNAVYSTVMNWLKSPEGGIRLGRNVLLFLGTLLVFRIIAGIVSSILGRTLRAFRNLSNLLRDFVVNTVSKLIVFVGFVVALSMLEVNIGPFLAAMGAAGFIIGFALQGTLSNFAAGIMILLYRPYDLGDEVTIAGVSGKVQSMTLVSTVVTNKDGHVITIPNSSIWGGTITNLSPTAPAAAR